MFSNSAIQIGQNRFVLNVELGKYLNTSQAIAPINKHPVWKAQIIVTSFFEPMFNSYEIRYYGAAVHLSAYSYSAK